MTKFYVKTGSNEISFAVQATMVISLRESVVHRYVQRMTADMHRNNRTEIGCPCRKCKLGSMFKPASGDVEKHLLRVGFMEGHTQWMGDDEDDDHDETNGAATSEDEEEARSEERRVGKECRL